MPDVYYIGGSPCSGKSTVAESLAKQYDLYYFKVDDFLDTYIERGALAGYAVCKRIQAMNPEQNWMREPQVQCEEELSFYREVFQFIIQDLKNISDERKVITEGAAYLPELMKQSHIAYDSYLSLTPTKDFQIAHYKKREWVPYILEGCSDKEKAFTNWMDRDALFAKDVQLQCEKERYLSIINNGENWPIEKLSQKIAQHFGLNLNSE